MYHDNRYGDEIDKKIVSASIKNLLSKVSINSDYEVPYVAGYSKDGETIYLDMELPEKLPNGTEYKQFIILHEVVEKALIDTDSLLYQHAHVIAMMAEKMAVEESGIKWNYYETFVRKYIKEDIKHTSNVPPDLDLTPYIDSKDNELITKIKKAQANGE